MPSLERLCKSPWGFTRIPLREYNPTIGKDLGFFFHCADPVPYTTILPFFHKQVALSFQTKSRLIFVKWRFQQNGGVTTYFDLLGVPRHLAETVCQDRYSKISPSTMGEVSSGRVIRSDHPSTKGEVSSGRMIRSDHPSTKVGVVTPPPRERWVQVEWSGGITPPLRERWVQVE